MIDEDAYIGNYKKNQFYFQHALQIGISVNGEKVLFRPLAYNTLFSGTAKLHGNSRSIIKREDYSQGYSIIASGLTPFKIGDNFDLKKRHH